MKYVITFMIGAGAGLVLGVHFASKLTRGGGGGGADTVEPPSADPGRPPGPRPMPGHTSGFNSTTSH